MVDVAPGNDQHQGAEEDVEVDQGGDVERRKQAVGQLLHRGESGGRAIARLSRPASAWLGKQSSKLI